MNWVVTKVAQMNLRVVLIREGEAWVAQCLEFDLAAQGSTLAEAQAAFTRLFLGQAMVDASLGKAPFENTPPAPAWYVEQYEKAVTWELAHKLSLVPPAEAVPALSIPVRAVAEVRIAA